MFLIYINKEHKKLSTNMGKYDQPNQQGSESKLKNPALLFFSYKAKPKTIEEKDESGKTVYRTVPPRFLASSKRGAIEVEQFDFMCGSHVYRVTGELNNEGKSAGTVYFEAFDKPVNFFVPGQKAVEITYKDLKASPMWSEHKLRLTRYSWGVARSLDKESGEFENVPAILELGSSFQNFDNGGESGIKDLGQLRTLIAGAGGLKSYEGSSWREIGFQEAEQDSSTEKLFETAQKDFVLFFRQWIPDYLSKYFDGNGDVIRFQDQV